MPSDTGGKMHFKYVFVTPAPKVWFSIASFFRPAGGKVGIPYSAGR